MFDSKIYTEFYPKSISSLHGPAKSESWVLSVITRVMNVKNQTRQAFVTCSTARASLFADHGMSVYQCVPNTDISVLF